jgi:dihydroflavonol-4-reductase
MEEAAKAKVQRIVHTSSTATLGRKREGLIDESTEPQPSELAGHYRRSKYMAEKAVMDMAREGLPAVVVNPSAPVGPWDVKPTRTGQIILDSLKGRMFAYMNTGLNLVDVEDVAMGHVLALEKGKAGERYILGNENLTLHEVLDMLSQITGRRGPVMRLPYPLVLGLAYLDRWVEGGLLRRPPFIPLEGIREARWPVWVDCAKAVRELGFPQNPIEGALEKAVEWFRDNHYI